PSSAGAVFRRGDDVPAVDQEFGAGAGGLGRGRGPDLVGGGIAGGPDAGGHDAEVRPVPALDGLDLDGGGDDAVEACVRGESREPGDLLAQGAQFPSPGLLEVGGGEGGQHRDADEERPVVAGGLAGGAQHRGAAGNVDGEHVDVEGAGGLDGACDRGGDVVELEVQEDALAALLESTDDVGPRGGEELGADLVPVDGGADALHQVERGPGIRQVEG